jgi:acetaldehyde dehydrogenase / alcohol dehydrogenase
MAHKLGSEFHLPHGQANALLINDVIRFNATNAPRKQAIFPQYKYPDAIQRYARMADYLGLQGNTPEEKVEALIVAIDGLKKAIGIPASIREAGVPEKEFREKIEHIAELAFDDQCTGANPRYPSIGEIRELYLKAFAGKK